MISSEPKANTENVFWFNSIFRAIKQAERSGETELFIIGGERIYKYALSLVDRIYLTEIHETVKGDVYFPTLSLKNWKKVSETQFEKGPSNDFSFTFQVLDRR